MEINKKQIVNIVTEEISKSEIIDTLKRDKDFERRVKEIAAEVVTDLFRVLWQHNGIFKNLGK